MVVVHVHRYLGQGVKSAPYVREVKGLRQFKVSKRLFGCGCVVPSFSQGDNDAPFGFYTTLALFDLPFCFREGRQQQRSFHKGLRIAKLG